MKTTGRGNSFYFGAGVSPKPLSYEVVSKRFGTKAAGLIRLPNAWVPTFVAVSTDLYVLWRTRKGDRLGQLLAECGLKWPELLDKLTAKGSDRLIIRSSAVGEGLDERGQFFSKVTGPDPDIENVEHAIIEVFTQFEQRAPDRTLAIIIQNYLTPDTSGHLSNEVRLSPTRNQWKFEIERPLASPPRGLNSKFAREPRSDTALSLPRGGPGILLRELAHWLSAKSDGRSHVEWLIASKTLWVLQWDIESPTSTGVDPRIMPNADRAATTEPNGLQYLRMYTVGTNTPWLKLKNVDDFQSGSQICAHRLFYIDGASAEEIRADPIRRSQLVLEISNVTANRAVVRTDSISSSLQSTNLPRTHTVDATEATRWILDRSFEFSKQSISPREYCFIVHRFVPARAAAWAYFQNGSNLVEIDALWGLPDGLQFLPHDSYQLDKNGRLISEKIRFKPQFLQEQSDGTWKYVSIARQFGRSRVLSKSALQYIAKTTASIAQRMNGDAQIMWFCDIPSGLDMGRHLPWYRAREFADRAAVAPPPFPTIGVARRSDLERVRTESRSRFIVRISPDADLVRDDAFLDEIIEVARTKGFPVELAGSVLGHAYYRLRKAGITVVTSEPYAAYYRTRGRKVFRKLVRDQIPDRIAFAGESVIQAELTSRQFELGLISKLFEEAQEFLLSKARSDRKEELSDLYEVIRGLAFCIGLSWEEIEQTADAKRLKRGGFERRTLLVETSYPKPVNATAGDLREIGTSVDQSNPVTIGEGLASVPVARLLAQGEKLSLSVPYKGFVITLSIVLRGSQCDLSIRAVNERSSDDSQGDALQLNLFDS